MSSMYYIGCLIYIPDVLFVFQMSDIHVWAPLNPGHSLMYKYALVMYMAQNSTEGALESNLREKSTRIATIVAMAPIEISSFTSVIAFSIPDSCIDLALVLCTCPV